MIARIEGDIGPNTGDVDTLRQQDETLSETLRLLYADADARRQRLDDLAVERREKRDSVQEAKDRISNWTHGRSLRNATRVYDSDVQRLESLEEGGAALLASSNRPCPLCGAEPEYQRQVHGLEEVRLAQQSAKAEIAKIRLQRLDLAKTISSLAAEADALICKATRVTDELEAIEFEIEKLKPEEGALREHYSGDRNPGADPEENWNTGEPPAVARKKDRAGILQSHGRFQEGYKHRPQHGHWP